MDIDNMVLGLEREWDFETGFFGLLRRGQFDLASMHRLVATLGSIQTHREPTIHRRLVSLLWYMPLFMVWQTERVREEGGDMTEYDKATNLIQSSVEHLLGVP